MFDRRLLLTGVAIVVTAALSLLIVNIPGSGEIVPLQEPVSYIEKRIPDSIGDIADDIGEGEYAYIIKSYEGHIAVFIPGKEEPEVVFETLVKYLPDYDRIQMETGIPVRDFEALSAIVEDYIS